MSAEFKIVTTATENYFFFNFPYFFHRVFDDNEVNEERAVIFFSLICNKIK